MRSTFHSLRLGLVRVGRRLLSILGTVRIRVVPCFSDQLKVVVAPRHVQLNVVEPRDWRQTRPTPPCRRRRTGPCRKTALLSTGAVSVAPLERQLGPHLDLWPASLLLVKGRRPRPFLNCSCFVTRACLAEQCAAEREPARRTARMAGGRGRRRGQGAACVFLTH